MSFLITCRYHVLSHREQNSTIFVIFVKLMSLLIVLVYLLSIQRRWEKIQTILTSFTIKHFIIFNILLHFKLPFPKQFVLTFQILNNTHI